MVKDLCCKNMIEATHEWTTVFGYNEKEVETKKFFKKATDGFVTVYNGGRGHPKPTSDAVDIIEKVPEKKEVNNPETIKAKIPNKKLQSEKGKENVSLNGKTKKVLGIYLQNR